MSSRGAAIQPSQHPGVVPSGLTDRLRIAKPNLDSQARPLFVMRTQPEPEPELEPGPEPGPGAVEATLADSAVELRTVGHHLAADVRFSSTTLVAPKEAFTLLKSVVDEFFLATL